MAQDPAKRRAATARYAARHRDKVLAAKRRTQAAWVKAHPEEKRARDAAYRTAHPEKAHAAFAKWVEANLDRKRAMDRAWRKANPDKVNAYNRTTRHRHPDTARGYNARYRAKHVEDHAFDESRRRARKRSAPRNDLTLAEWQAIKRHYDYRCVYCQRQMQRLTQDHIQPLSKGGSHTLQNVVPACLSCNSKKGDRAPLVPVQPLLLLERAVS
jgi:5-methylcytosine-specific restriction endonuclease McrA